MCLNNLNTWNPGTADIPCFIIWSFAPATNLRFLLLTLIYVFANIRQPEGDYWVVKAEFGDAHYFTVMQCVTAGGWLEPLAVCFRYPSSVVHSILKGCTKWNNLSISWTQAKLLINSFIKIIHLGF